MKFDALSMAELFRTPLPADAVRLATAGDVIGSHAPPVVVEPSSADEVAEALRLASERGLAVAIRGAGARLDWGCPLERCDLVLSTRRLNRVVEHAAGDMIITVEAGVLLADLQAQAATAGQMLALDPAFPARTTAGGLIATADSGSLRVRYGGVRDQLIGVQIVRADGVVARGGGKVVKNVAGYDLPKLFTGSYGTLGVITEATFRLYPVPRAETTLRIVLPEPESAAIIPAILAAPVVSTGLTVARQDGGALTLLVRVSGLAAANQAMVETITALVADHGLLAETLEPAESPAAWQAVGNQPWGSDSAAVLKCGFLPSDCGTVLDILAMLERTIGVRASAILHGHGLGLVCLAGGAGAQIEAIGRLRLELARLSGTAVILIAADAVKAQADVWGLHGGSLRLMQEVRRRFDPGFILNPGRMIPR